MDPAASEPLALPAPESSITKSLQKLHIDQTIKLDDLGPMVVNSDGVCTACLPAKIARTNPLANPPKTLSRIANWKDLTKQEQERTIRVLGARNK